MNTDILLLKRSMGLAISEDYIEWAVERLCEGLDSPSLRILAGLNLRFERHEVEPYFKKTCEELGIGAPPETADPREAAFLIKRAYSHGEMSVEETLNMMSDLYQRSDYGDPLLSVWFNIEEELAMRDTGHEGIFYPPEALGSLEEVFDREWALLERAIGLNLPQDFIQFIRCDLCAHIGKSKMKHRTMVNRIKAKLPFIQTKPALWHTCAACGSYEYHSMIDPEVRDAYFSQLEHEQSHSADP
jgi:hypothetical protein